MTSLNNNICPKTNFAGNSLNCSGCSKFSNANQNKSHNGDGIKGPHFKPASNKHLGKNHNKLV